MAPKRSQTLTIAAAAASLAALAVAGCGADKPAGTTTATAAAQAPAPAAAATATTPTAAAPAASDPVAHAAATTDRQDGAVAFAMKGVVTTKGQPVPLSARGTIDRKRQRGAFTTETRFGPKAFTVQQVVDKQLLYLRSSLFAGKLPGGKSWMKVDLAEAAKTPGLDLDALGASGPSQDPVSGLDYLQGAGAAKKLGAAKVDGVATTRYRVQVDLKRAAKRSAQPAAKRAIDRLIATLGGPVVLPVDVWVDGDHLVRRQRVGYTATVAGQTSRFDITTDYTAYGAKITTRPPADGATFDGLDSLKAAAKARQEAEQSQQAQG
jgi:hypothetical protein